MEKQVRSLSIQEWHQLGLEGNMLPVTICLEGDSMRPLIRRGKDPVTILPLSRPLIKGDVVLFQGGPARYVVHRVYRLRDGWVQTYGDNCWNPDSWMPLEQVWGLVVRMERFGRTWRLDTPAARCFGRLWMLLHPVWKAYRKLRSLGGRVYRKLIRRRETRESTGGH